jgi:hypothetical protein
MNRELPVTSELARETRRRMMAAPQTAISVRRDERDRLCDRSGHHLGDDVTRDRGEVAKAALLPGRDE